MFINNKKTIKRNLNLVILLQQKIKNLKEETRELKVIRNIQNKITQTLNFQEVAQLIVDGIYYISPKLFSTAAMYIVNSEKKQLQLCAVTIKDKYNIPLFVKGIRSQQMLGRVIPLYGQKCGLQRALKSRKISYFRNFTELLYPYLSKSECEAITKLRKAKTIIVMPIIIENKIEGCNIVG